MRIASTVLQIAAIAVVGCSSKLPRAQHIKGTGEQIAESKTLGIVVPHFSSVRLTEGKKSLRATFATSQNGSKITNVISVEGEPYETEVFETTSESLGVIRMVDDTFSPPLLLARFPMNLGDVYAWEGTVTYGGIARKATAETRVHPQRDHQNVVIQSKISIDAGPGKPVERTLALKVSRTGGMVERDYSPYSKRDLILF